MTNLDNLKSLSLEGFAEWLDALGYSDIAPWNEWFDYEYCNNCEPIELEHKQAEDELGISSFAYGIKQTCAYCELYKRCKFFPDLEEQPNQVEVIKLWLRKESNS